MAAPDIRDPGVVVRARGPVGLRLPPSGLDQGRDRGRGHRRAWRPAGTATRWAFQPSRPWRCSTSSALAAGAVDGGRPRAAMSSSRSASGARQIPLGEGRDFPFAAVAPQSELETRRARDSRAWACACAGPPPRGLEPGPRGMNAARGRLEKESGGYAVAAHDGVVDKTIEVSAEFVLGADGHRRWSRATLGSPSRRRRPRSPSRLRVRPRRSIGERAAARSGGGHVSAMWPLPEGGRGGASRSCPRACRAVRPREESPLTRVARASSSIRRGRAPVRSPSGAVVRAESRRGWLDDRGAFRAAPRGGLGTDRPGSRADAVHLTGPVGMQSMNGGLTRLALRRRREDPARVQER
jgi:hypothetical protein